MHKINEDYEIQAELEKLNSKLSALLNRKINSSWENLDPRVSAVIGKNQSGYEKYKGGFRTLNEASKKSLDIKYFSEGISFQNLFTHEILKSMGKDEKWLFSEWDSQSDTHTIDNQEIIFSKLSSILSIVEKTDSDVNEMMNRAYPTKKQNAEQAYFLLTCLLDWASDNLLNADKIDVLKFFLLWQTNRSLINKKSSLYKISQIQECSISQKAIEIVYLFLFLALFFHYLITFCEGYFELYEKQVSPVEFENESNSIKAYDEFRTFLKNTLYKKIITIINQVFEYHPSCESEEISTDLREIVKSFILNNKNIVQLPQEKSDENLQKMICFKIPVNQTNLMKLSNKIWFRKDNEDSYHELYEKLDEWQKELDYE